MCLAVPGMVLAVNGDRAVVDIQGVTYNAGLSLVEDVKPGDYVILHSGYVLEKLDKTEALKTLDLFADLERVLQTPRPASL